MLRVALGRRSEALPGSRRRPEPRALAHGAGSKPAMVCVISLGFALALHVALIPYHNGDIDGFLLPWLHHILEYGISRSLADDFYNYTPPYLYLLSLASRLHGVLSEIAIIKAISIFFAFVSAGLVFVLVRQLRPAPPMAAFAAAGFLFLPTVVLNGPYWGQADLLPTSGLLAFMICMFARRPLAAAVCFGVALAIKLQALFLGPFLLFLVLRGEVRWRHLLAIPVVYFVAVLPAALAGRPFLDLFLVYAHQADFYARLSMNAPNPHHFLQALTPLPYRAAVLLGLVLAGVAGLGLAFGGARRLRKDRESQLLLALVSVMLMPFLLPKVHDRHFFSADVFAYVVACCHPRLWWAAVGLQVSSLLACSNFLFGFYPGPFIGGAVNTLLVAGLLRELWRHLDAGGDPARPAG